MNEWINARECLPGPDCGPVILKMASGRMIIYDVPGKAPTITHYMFEDGEGILQSTYVQWWMRIPFSP